MELTECLLKPNIATLMATTEYNTRLQQANQFNQVMISSIIIFRVGYVKISIFENMCIIVTVVTFTLWI